MNNEMESIQALASIIKDVSVSAVFLWLFIRENGRYVEAVNNHMNDLRLKSASWNKPTDNE